MQNNTSVHHVTQLKDQVLKYSVVDELTAEQKCWLWKSEHGTVTKGLHWTWTRKATDRERHTSLFYLFK